MSQRELALKDYIKKSFGTVQLDDVLTLKSIPEGFFPIKCLHREKPL